MFICGINLGMKGIKGDMGLDGRPGLTGLPGMNGQKGDQGVPGNQMKKYETMFGFKKASIVFQWNFLR